MNESGIDDTGVPVVTYFCVMEKSPSFRLITDGPCSAEFNMAADRYLLERTVFEQRPIVRLYGWERPTITLGQSQRFEEIFDAAVVLNAGIDHIIRPTGGRAVFHDEDLTYAVAFPVGYPGMGATVNDTYAVIADCFRIGFSMAGIDVGLETVSRTGNQMRSEVRLPCFISAGRHEVLAGGRKLVGSAQKRTAAAVLQHGSIPLSGAFRNLPRYQRIPADEQNSQIEELTVRCACVEELSDIPLQDLVKALASGFSQGLAAVPEISAWTNEEVIVINQTPSAS